jgi:dTDP-4-dehydrorhamnose 3,5-epimerase
MKVLQTPINGCVYLELPSYSDKRGNLTKVFSSKIYSLVGLKDRWSEVFFSTSRKWVIRGLHYQEPPADHEKIVVVVRGKIFDAIVDIRKNSNTYGQNLTTILSAESPRALYIEKGFAHGFQALEQETVVAYLAGSVHCPERDKGVLWNSCSINWPNSSNCVISERDSNFPTFERLETPFD